ERSVRGDRGAFGIRERRRLRRAWRDRLRPGCRVRTWCRPETGEASRVRRGRPLPERQRHRRAFGCPARWRGGRSGTRTPLGGGWWDRASPVRRRGHWHVGSLRGGSERGEDFDIASRSKCESSVGSVAGLGGVAELGFAEGAVRLPERSGFLGVGTDGRIHGPAGEVARRGETAVAALGIGLCRE